MQTWFWMILAMKYGLVANKLFAWYQVRMPFLIVSAFFEFCKLTNQDSVECRTGSLKSLVSGSSSQHAPKLPKVSIQGSFPPLLIIKLIARPPTPNSSGAVRLQKCDLQWQQQWGSSVLCVKGIGDPSRCVKSSNHSMNDEKISEDQKPLQCGVSDVPTEI